MSESPEEVQVPPLELTVTLNGEPATVKMVYGIEMDIRRLLPDPSTAMQLALTDQFTQDYIVRRLLTPNKKMLKEVSELIPEDEIELSTEDVERMIEWTVEHLLYFFAKRTNSIAQLGARFNKSLPNLSKTGSPSSASETPSVGLSESSKEG
jgi:hypothetical protein